MVPSASLEFDALQLYQQPFGIWAMLIELNRAPEALRVAADCADRTE